MTLLRWNFDAVRITAVAPGEIENHVTAPFISPPISIPSAARGGLFDRADIVVAGIEQDGPSFEGRVFLGNPDADADTDRAFDAGYAGAFHVYGQGPAAAAGAADSGVRAPITKNVTATDAVRAATREADELTVTIVPVARGGGEPAPLDVRVSIIFHQQRRASDDG